MQQIDYSKIVLTDHERQIFDRFNSQDTATLTKQEFQVLRKQGLIKNSINGKTSWFDHLPEKGVCILSDKGMLYRQYLQNQAKNNAQTKRQLRFDNKIAILNVLIPFITFLLGLFVEYYIDIFGTIISVFM